MTQSRLLALPSGPPDSVADMKSSEAETLILAGAATVWDIITDAGNYPVWDSGITAASGAIRHPPWGQDTDPDTGRRQEDLQPAGPADPRPAHGLARRPAAGTAQSRAHIHHFRPHRDHPPDRSGHRQRPAPGPGPKNDARYRPGSYRLRRRSQIPCRTHQFPLEGEIFPGTVFAVAPEYEGSPQEFPTDHTQGPRGSPEGMSTGGNVHGSWFTSGSARRSWASVSSMK
ncbi:hypothetical protein ABIB51_001172 [Arthrobacter sp. UYCu712]